MADRTGDRPAATSSTAAGMWDWFVLDRTTGESTVFMRANLPIGIFWAVTAVRVVAHPGGTAGTVLRLTAGGALTWWAADELVRGTSPLRRTMGAVTLAGLAARVARSRPSAGRRG